MTAFLMDIISPLAYLPSSAGGVGMHIMDMTAIIILGIAGLISFAVQQIMKAKMLEYSHARAPMTGCQVAERMLQENGLRHVKITATPGHLTDHYNPMTKTVNLSQTVYGDKSIAAMAVAAHECGHALQHAQGYAFLQLRSALVPMVNFGATWGYWVIIIGLILAMFGGSLTLAWIGLALFATTTIFAFITLPVEFDASRRALAWLRQTGALPVSMQGQAKSALSWAAMTYVAAALSSLAMIIYYAIIIASHARKNSR